MSDLKVLMVTPYPPQENGIAVYSQKLVDNLNKQVEVITAGPSEGTDHYVELDTFFSFRKKIKEIKQDEDPDIIHYQHTGEVFGKLQGLQIPSFDDVENIVTFHEPDADMPYNWYSIFTRIGDLAQRKLVEKMDNGIVHLEYNKERFTEEYDAQNIEVIRHGVDQKPQKNNQKGKVEKILCFGLISGNKDLSLVTKLAEENPEKEFTVAGKVSNGSLEELDTDLNNIELINRWITEEEKENLYHETDAVVLPYIHQNSASGVLSEAIAYGKPVLATDIPVFKEVVEGFNLGVTASIEKFSLGLDKLEENGNYAQYILNYRNENSWQEKAVEHIELYEKIS